jgi:outer membrane protein assembly factor BamB
MTAALLALLVAAQDWPRFRGPTGQGVAAEAAPPLEWSATSGVLWKTPVPGEGWSSPVVAGGRVFVTAASENGTRCRILGFDAVDGKVVFDTPVFDQVPSRKEGKNSYATPTPCTDGRRVYAVFGDGGAAAVDVDGKLLWTNRDVTFYSRHGLGSSPVLVDGLLIMPYDGSNRVDVAGQYPKVTDEERLGWQLPWDRAEVVALDAETGKRAWTAKRGKSRIAHVTPILAGGALISPAGDAVQAFDPKTGALLWTAYSQGEGVVPSPVTDGTLLFTASGYEKSTLRAFKLGGSGDVTASHVAWEQKKGVPSQVSLVLAGPQLYAVTDQGVMTAYAPATGEVLWQERLAEKQTFSPSPVLAAGRIYVLSEQGETHVVEAGPAFKRLARNPLGEKCQASPAFAGGRIYIRTEKSLVCVGAK